MKTPIGKPLTRRSLLAAVPVGAAAAAGISTMARAATTLPERWDIETDVLVLGYGGAGATAAVTAHDAGAKVLILEKQLAAEHTSNTQMSFGAFLSPDNVDDTIAYMDVASRANVDMPESKDIDDDTIRVWAEESVRNRDWLSQMGAPGFSLFANAGRDSDWPGNSAIKAYRLNKADGSPGVGVDFFRFLEGLVSQRGIEVRWGTAASKLIRDGDGAVLGAIAEGPGGRQIAIRAGRAVVVSTGGFEFDAAAQRTYMAAYPMTYYGNPQNTGDGMRMCQEVGADLWHMTVLGGGFKLKFDDFPTAFAASFGSGSYVVVDKGGRRFKSETQLGGYSGYWNALVYDTVEYTWPRIPSWFVFDEKRRTEGRLVPTLFGAAGPIGMYEWSEDNSAEIARGWILSADSLESLGAQMGVDAAALANEIELFNSAASAGEDAVFGRPAGSMAPLDSPPYYAVALWPGLNNTFGGPRRNAQAQVLDAFGAPIPHLYSAGELGSIFVQYPQGGANIGECLAFGRVAGTNAAAEDPV